MSKPTELILPDDRVDRPRPYNPPALSDNGADKIMQIVERMLREPAFDLDRVEKMLALKAQWEAAEAKKAFTADMAAFKMNPPILYKNKHVGFTSKRTESSTDYDHATHSEVTMKIIPALAAHGFSHNWVTEQPEGKVKVTCIITHRLGH